METTGRHVLVEYRGCNRGVLDDKPRLEAMMRRAAEIAGATVVGTLFHNYAPQGVSGVVVVEESHFSIHTWPEYGYAAADFYTCGECRPEAAHDELMAALEATDHEMMVVDRGRSVPGRSIRIASHRRSSPPETVEV